MQKVAGVLTRADHCNKNNVRVWTIRSLWDWRLWEYQSI